jgi:hypothetical protein
MVSNGARIVKSLNLVQYSHYYSPLTGFYSLLCRFCNAAIEFCFLLHPIPLLSVRIHQLLNVEPLVLFQRIGNVKHIPC